MPGTWPIRNIHIENKHPIEVASECVTRKITPEEWQKYGPKSDKKRRNYTNIQLENKSMKSKLDLPTIIELATKHSLSKEGRSKIAAELGSTRAEVTNFVNRPYVKKALTEAGIIISPEKQQLVKDIAKELNTPVADGPVTTHKLFQENSKFISHMNLCANLHETYVAKNTAYGDSFSITFKEFGIVSAIIRMSDKWNRIKTLAKGSENKVKDESIKDTLLDLANYAIMTVMELEGGEKSEKTSTNTGNSGGSCTTRADGL